MSKPSAEKALDWLMEQVESLNALRNANTRDPGFREWRQNTLTILQRIWPGQTARAQRFRRVPFAPPSARATEQEARDCFERGFAEARKLLKMWETELRHLGTDGSDLSSDEAPASPMLRAREAEPPDPPGPAPSAQPRMGGVPASKQRQPKVPLRDMLGLEQFSSKNNPSGRPASAPPLRPAATPPLKPAAVLPPKPAPPPPRPATAPPSKAGRARSATRPRASGQAPAKITSVASSRRRTPESSASRTPPPAPPASALPSDALGQSIADAIEQSRHEAPAHPVQPPASAAQTPAPPVHTPPSQPPVQQAPPPRESAPQALEQLPGGLHIEPGFQGQIDEPALSSAEVRLSTTLGAHGQEPPSVRGGEIRALMEELPRLGVPEHDLTRVSLALAELSVQLDHGPVRWDSIRGAMTLVMDYPGLARRAVPLLLRHFDAAA